MELVARERVLLATLPDEVAHASHRRLSRRGDGRACHMRLRRSDGERRLRLVGGEDGLRRFENAGAAIAAVLVIGAGRRGEASDGGNDERQRKSGGTRSRTR